METMCSLKAETRTQETKPVAQAARGSYHVRSETVAINIAYITTLKTMAIFRKSHLPPGFPV